LILFCFCLVYFTITKYQEKPIVNSIHSFALSKEEKTSLNEFFCDLLFADGGAYTLYGTKPMTLSLIHKPLTEDENKSLNSLSKKEKEKLYSFRPNLDFLKYYLNWEKVKPKLSFNHYLFGKFSLNEHYDVLFFVNIEMAIRTLIKYYNDYKRILGYDFDPFKIVFEVENPQSQFWNDIIKNHALLGILLGYGQANSWFFKWNLQYDNADSKMGNFIRHLHSKFYEKKIIKYPTSRYFSLPTFRSYGTYPDDKELLNRYNKERKKIKLLYLKHDPVNLALSYLTR